MIEKYAVTCVNCGNNIIDNIEGKKICPVCFSKEFMVTVYPEKLICLYCKRVYLTEWLKKMWIDIPFYNSKDKTFYCGCRGWE